MKDGIGKVVFVLTLVFIILLFSGPYLINELWNVQSGQPTILELTFNNIIDDLDSFINTNKYNKILNEYIDKRYGNSLSKKIRIIKNDGWRYEVKCDDIMDETFYISYFKGLDGCSDNFDKVISKDKKFQHLYSEWVKTQVGIEDENVELGFAGNFDEPYIDFDKITTLSEDYREVFENTHNLFLDTINIKNITEVNDNYIDIFYNVKNNYYYKVVDLLGSPNKISLFVYFDDYRFIYDFPEEELESVSKRNEHPDEHNGLIWSSIY